MAHSLSSNSRASRPSTPTISSQKAATTPNSHPPFPVSPSSSKKSFRISPNKRWIQEQQRRAFMHHLYEWSLNHDSSPYFNGKISLLPQDSKSGEVVQLGKSVNCILTDSKFTDARRRIVIRLFPPQKDTMRSGHQQQSNDSADPFGPYLSSTQDSNNFLNLLHSHATKKPSPHAVERPRNYYTLVVRCGSGWMSAREYFNKIYFNALSTSSAKAYGPHGNLGCTPDTSLKKRSQTLGPPPAEKDSVTIRPLFRPFLNLPPELQEMILLTAVCWTRKWNLSRDREGYGGFRKASKAEKSEPPINLGTMFCISRAITERIRPWIYRSTDFSFGITGFAFPHPTPSFAPLLNPHHSFTSFLWSLCPRNRQHIRRLTFHFRSIALLHCIRWLSPDPIFALFEPPVNTNPPNLQFFWRMQLQDLMREVHLHTLTLDVTGVPVEDIPFVARLLVGAFGSVQNVVFIETHEGETGQRVERRTWDAHWFVVINDDNNAREDTAKKPLARKHQIRTLDKTDDKLKLVGKQSWRALCRDYFKRYHLDSYFLKRGLMFLAEDQVESIMDCNKVFFDDG